MTKIRAKKFVALAALSTLLLEACGGRVLESDAADGADPRGRDDGGALGAGAGGALQVANAGGSSAEAVAGAAGLCGAQGCECVVGTQRPCNAHAEDGIGTCTAGSQECVLFAGNRVAFGDCQGEVGPTAEGCGPQMPDTNCNGIPGDGDYQIQPGCARTFNSGYGKLVHLFAAPHPGTVAVHLCQTRCKSFSYLAPSCDGNPILSDEIQGYAAATAVPNYVFVDSPASSCAQSATYGNAAYDVHAPAFSFYTLP